MHGVGCHVLAVPGTMDMNARPMPKQKTTGPVQVFYGDRSVVHGDFSVAHGARDNYKFTKVGGHTFYSIRF